MNTHALSKNETLVVSGPASISLIEGKATVLGAPLRPGAKTVVRRGRSLPVYAEEDSQVSVVLGEGGEVLKVEGSTLPPDWVAAVEAIADGGRPSVVIVVGDVDSGKTAFTTLVSNHLVLKGYRVAVVDGDVGQSDIGPPTTVGFALLTKPVADLFSAEPIEMEFIGNTNPYTSAERIASAIASLARGALERGADYVAVNTDGWVQGEEAIRYKLSIIEKTSPRHVVALGEGEAIKQILSMCPPSVGCITLSPVSNVAKKRERDVRKQLREQGYRRYLKGASVRSIPLGWVSLQNCALLRGKPIVDPATIDWLESELGVKVIYAEESPGQILVVVKQPPREKVENLRDKKLRALCEGDEAGLIVGLYGKTGFLGIGVLEGIDFQRKVLKVYTPVREAVQSISIGCIRLEKDGKEVCSLPAPPI